VTWTDGAIPDCVVTDLRRFHDDRGWLAEIFRDDERPGGIEPAMSYVSLTRAGVGRGPHAHRDQTDLFAFVDGRFRLYLWDARDGSATRGTRQVMEFGRDRPATVVVPPGVVHGYRNVGDSDALIVNCPDRLYAGRNRAEPVDEIRYEDDPDPSYRMD
jgi:dTDP-4-dehydrorhamnose 3,5-epimerase